MVKRAAVNAQRNGGFIAIHYKGEVLENPETPCKPPLLIHNVLRETSCLDRPHITLNPK